MSHESILQELSALIKRRVMSFSPVEHIQHIMTESDRAFIILHAATAEDLLLAYLEDRMSGLNSDEKKGLLQFNGPAGTFSGRIALAHGLRIITRKTRKDLEIIKAMRNAAAHAHGPLDFDTPEVKRATAQFFRPKHRPDVMSWSREDTREIFGVVATLVVSIIGDESRVANPTELYEIMKSRQAARSASRDTH